MCGLIGYAAFLEVPWCWLPLTAALAAFMLGVLICGAQDRYPKRGRAVTAEAAPVTVGPDNRNAILHFAACLLPTGKRPGDAVITMAGPLLEWAAGAADKDDLRARMQAMGRAFDNDRVRLRETESPVAGFLACASAYYAFITGVANEGAVL
jgi:hypothetical protein